jgi:tryptophan synthase beta chain
MDVDPKDGRFSGYGGRYVPEVLRAALDDIDAAFKRLIRDPDFLSELEEARANYVGRPTPLYRAANLSRSLGGADVYVKMEGLAHTGAHKINNALGQALLAKRMGMRRVIAETGAGQHGLATAAVCAKLGLACEIYMGSVDIARQRPNVFGMELFGAKVVPVESGSRTLKDAINEAMRDWAGSFKDTYYLIGSALGPSPYPDMVREFQSVIGKETMAQASERGLDVAAMVACVGGGSNAIGFFSQCLDSKGPRLIGAEAGGRGPGTGNNAARMQGDGRVGIVHGYKSRFLLDGDGQVRETHSISAGLDYPGIGPQLAALGDSGRVEFVSVTDAQAIDALKRFAAAEGIIFALESAHAGAAALELAKGLPKGKAVIVNMSGRGDKDIFITAKAVAPGPWMEFLKREVEDYERQ